MRVEVRAEEGFDLGGSPPLDVTLIGEMDNSLSAAIGEVARSLALQVELSTIC